MKALVNTSWKKSLWSCILGGHIGTHTTSSRDKPSWDDKHSG
jgi:hypothetical protein